ncbi:hypothetical protein [Sorangium sp. So ce1151]|uniref:hypothetical protein n=1 Tax=Sorangium sp. So ce1151 TaxID=3133332 RepID=UPI003F6481DF
MGEARRQRPDVQLPDRRGLGTFIWEPTEYHERIFEADGDIIADMIAPYDQMKVDYKDF